MLLAVVKNVERVVASAASGRGGVGARPVEGRIGAWVRAFSRGFRNMVHQFVDSRLH